VHRLLDAHFPRCDGTVVVQGDAETKGTCGCEGLQHWYSPAEVAALLFAFFPDVYAELCGSVGNPSFENLNRCLQQIEGQPLWLGRDSQRRINRKVVRNAILGVRRQEQHAARATHGATKPLCVAQRSRGPPLPFQCTTSDFAAQCDLASATRNADPDALTPPDISKHASRLSELSLESESLVPAIDSAKCDSAKCDKCDGPHPTDECPSFPNARDDHPDARPPDTLLSAADTPPLTVRGKLVKQPNDNSCLFHSLAHGLTKAIKGGPKLRQKLLAWLRNHSTDEVQGQAWADWIAKQTMPDKEASLSQAYGSRSRSTRRTSAGMTVPQYVEMMKSDTAWGGAIEIALCQHSESVSVWIFKRAGDGSYERTSVFGSATAERVVSIVAKYDRAGSIVHYDALELADE